MGEKKGFKEFNIKDVYTPLSVAEKEIKRRWKDEDLKKKVEDFLGGDIPDVLKKEPRAISTRQVATPNKEFAMFYDLAYLSGLKPLCWEFHEDIFVTTNRDTASLGKIGFFNRFNKKFDPLLSYKKIIDLTGSCEKKTFREIKTVFGENLIEFHHSILKILFPDIELYDASKWYKRKGNDAKEYYPFLLALFIRHGILFDNFNMNGYEREFSLNIVFPALKKVEKIFGIKPLIVRMVPEDDINCITLACYPDNLLKYLKEKKWKITQL